MQSIEQNESIVFKWKKFHRNMEQLGDRFNSASPLLCKSSIKKDEEEEGEEKRGRKKGEDERISTDHI